MQVLAEMVILNCMRLLLCFYSEISMVVVECEFDGRLWQDIWDRVKNYLDQPAPQLLQRIQEINIDLKEALDFYSTAETCVLSEFPSICGSYGQVPKPIADVLPIRPHHYPDASEQQKVVNAHEPVDKDFLIGDMQDLCCEGINFLQNEATDIVAFVVADSQRLNRPGIPPHVPIAYAMHGPSFTNESLHKMLTDVCLCCQSHNVGIMCEITDSEFIKLIHTSENGHTLSHFQRLKAMFKYYEQFSRSQLVDMIIHEVHPPYTMKWDDIHIPFMPDVWKQHFKKMQTKESKKSSSQQRKSMIEDLSFQDKLDLLEGTKWNRWLRSKPNVIDVQRQSGTTAIPTSSTQWRQSGTTAVTPSSSQQRQSGTTAVRASLTQWSQSGTAAVGASLTEWRQSGTAAVTPSSSQWRQSGTTAIPTSSTQPTHGNYSSDLWFNTT